jgi:hypothetical protein
MATEWVEGNAKSLERASGCGVLNFTVESGLFQEACCRVSRNAGSANA